MSSRRDPFRRQREQWVPDGTRPAADPISLEDALLELKVMQPEIEAQRFLDKEDYLGEIVTLEALTTGTDKNYGPQWAATVRLNDGTRGRFTFSRRTYDTDREFGVFERLLAGHGPFEVAVVQRPASGSRRAGGRPRFTLELRAGR